MAWESSLVDYPEHLQAIGMVSVEISNLELMLATLFADVCDLREKIAHAIYFAPRATALRVEILRVAADVALRQAHPNPDPSDAEKQLTERMDGHRRKVLAICRRSLSVIQKRHDVMHAVWLVDRKTSEVFRGSIQAAADRNQAPVPLHELTDLVRAIRAVIDDAEHTIDERYC